MDVGAHAGQFARWISGIFPQARIYCFEPLPDPYAQLRIWADGQAGGRVSTFNVALGDRDADAVMQVHVDYTYSSSLLPATELTDALFPETRRRAPLPVKQERLDGLVERHRLDLKSDLLIKLDVQGFEDRVIAGGPHTFRHARACMIEVDLDQLYTGQPRFLDLVRALDELGLEYAGNLDQYYAPDGHVIYADAVFLRG